MIKNFLKQSTCRGCNSPITICPDRPAKWWKQSSSHNFPSRMRRIATSKEYYCQSCFKKTEEYQEYQGSDIID